MAWWCQKQIPNWFFCPCVQSPPGPHHCSWLITTQIKNVPSVNLFTLPTIHHWTIIIASWIYHVVLAPSWRSGSTSQFHKSDISNGLFPSGFLIKTVCVYFLISLTCYTLQPIFHHSSSQNWRAHSLLCQHNGSSRNHLIHACLSEMNLFISPSMQTKGSKVKLVHSNQTWVQFSPQSTYMDEWHSTRKIYKTNYVRTMEPLFLALTLGIQIYLQGLYRKSWATFFCMRTGNSRWRRVWW